MARTRRTRLKLCTIQPEGGGVGATPRNPGEQVATSERVDNVRVLPFGGSPQLPRAAVERFKLWQNGRTLRVSFLDGVAAVKTKVEAIAKEWETEANLRLQFVTSGAAEIRVSFAEEGFSWSTVGTDALTVGRTKPTMNYGWLEPNTATKEYQRVVRHEFGHALGMIHEHQNPDAKGKIPWDKPKVYAYYAEQGWSKEDVDFNIFQVYDADATNFTKFDPTSIMEYAIPEELTVGKYSIGWNTALSQLDRTFMRRQYPTDAAGMVELTIGARHEADLSAGGEIDTYHVDITETATYIMTTTGATDTVLTLHGPNDAGAVFAWDDDRGRGTNARIVRRMTAGEYWLTVRHKERHGTGAYDVGITTRRA